MPFVRFVYHIDERVRVVARRLGVLASTWSVFLVAWAAELAEVISQLCARRGYAPWLQNEQSGVSTVLRDQS